VVIAWKKQKLKEFFKYLKI